LIKTNGMAALDSVAASPATRSRLGRSLISFTPITQSWTGIPTSLRCETHAIRVDTSSLSIAGECPYSLVYFIFTPPFRPQSGMTIFNYFQNHGWCHSTVPSMLQQAAISSARAG
jgi:hypothetical protein